MTDFPPTANPASPPTAKALALEDWLVVLIMAALALITFANVLLRYFTDTSFAWTEEISIFLMIVLAMVGGSSAVARDQHIRIEFFSGNGSAQRRRRLARLGALMTALLFTVLAVLSVRLVWDDGRYYAEHGAQVDEEGLRSGAHGERVGAPFGDELGGGHGPCHCFFQCMEGYPILMPATGPTAGDPPSRAAVFALF